MAIIYILVLCTQLSDGRVDCQPISTVQDKATCQAIADQANAGMSPGMEYRCAYREEWRFTR